MSIIACPRCRDEVMLPANASPQARVRCPLCRDEYTLSEALAKMPPMLILLDAGPGADVGGYGEPEYKVAGGAGMFDSSPAIGGDAAPMAAPRPMKTGGARPKKKSGGAVSQIVQVVLGGVGAVILFHALAWWTPLLGYQDPMGAGPMVAKFLPQIVPPKFRGAPSGNANNGGGNIAKNDNNSKPPVPAVVAGKKNGNVFDTGDKFKNLDPGGLQPTLDPLDPGNPVIPPEPDTKPEVKIDDPLNPITPKPMPEKPIDFTPPMPKPVDPNAKPFISSAEITQAYAFAVNKREDFEAAAGEEAAVRRQKGKDLYDAAAELGKLCAGADMSEGENADKVTLIKEELGNKIAKYATMMALFADQRLADGAKEEAIAVSGVIKDIKPLGATHETTIEVTRPDKTLFTVPVVTTKSLEDDGAKVGSTVVVLGKIVRDVKKDLPAYKGESPQVIHAGHVTLPAAP